MVRSSEMAWVGMESRCEQRYEHENPADPWRENSLHSRHVPSAAMPPAALVPEAIVLVCCVRILPRGLRGPLKSEPCFVIDIFVNLGGEKSRNGSFTFGGKMTQSPSY